MSKGVSFWEIEVRGVKAASRNTNGRSVDRGFIVVSTGRHDFPVPHWSLELEPPSRTLEAQAKKGPVSKIIKVDALAYVAETEKGGYLAHIGQLPMRPTGMPRTLPEEPTLSSLESHPTTETKSDRRGSKQEIKRTGVRAPRPKLTKWDSWGQLKRQFSSAYRLQLKSLRQQAERAWEIEDLVGKLGEGIHEGDRLIVPLLAAGKADLSGEGADAVEMRTLDRKTPAVELIAQGGREQAEQSFQLDLAYEDGSSETLNFFVIPKGTPSNRRRTLPHPEPLPPR